MEKVRMAVIGLGNMGSHHCDVIADMDNAELTAVCDVDEQRVQKAAKHGCRGYTDADALFRECELDAVVIATPHYQHTDLTVKAFERGIHVLTEKPIAAQLSDAGRMIAAWREARRSRPDIVFAAMFQQRTQAAAVKIKDFLNQGELGKLIRATWIITDWYRTQAYYDSGGWRATWKGEGGGVLMNQCPHQLDMYQWFFGLPQRVRGFASLGKYHDIEVEDEVTAYFEHDNGMVGHFITSTGEAPGTNRLEIVGEFGKLIWEDNALQFYRNRISLLKHLREARTGFAKPECWPINIPLESGGGLHRSIIENFRDVILGKTDTVIAPAEEGYNSLAIDNGIMLSSMEEDVVALPPDESRYEALLQTLITGSARQKQVREIAAEDFSNSF